MCSTSCLMVGPSDSQHCSFWCHLDPLCRSIRCSSVVSWYVTYIFSKHRFSLSLQNTLIQTDSWLTKCRVCVEAKYTPLPRLGMDAAWNVQVDSRWQLAFLKSHCPVPKSFAIVGWSLEDFLCWSMQNRRVDKRNKKHKTKHCKCKRNMFFAYLFLSRSGNAFSESQLQCRLNLARKASRWLFVTGSWHSKRNLSNHRAPFNAYTNTHHQRVKDETCMQLNCHVIVHNECERCKINKWTSALSTAELNPVGYKFDKTIFNCWIMLLCDAIGMGGPQ